MAKTLRMHFTTASGDNWTMSLKYPKDGLTKAQVDTAMQAVIDSGIFLKGPAAIAGCDVVDRTVTEITA